jgi:hypothetical protein
VTTTTVIDRRGKLITVETLTNPAATKIRRRRPGTFVQVPLASAARAYAAMHSPKAMVWLWLQYQVWKTKSKVVAVPNGVLAEYGVSPDVKRAALLQLEVAGLITVDRRPRQTPIVTVL